MVGLPSASRRPRLHRRDRHPPTPFEGTSPLGSAGQACPSGSLAIVAGNHTWVLVSVLPQTEVIPDQTAIAGNTRSASRTDPRCPTEDPVASLRNLDWSSR